MAFCKENDLAEHAFYPWWQKFRREQRPVTFALVEAKQTAKESSGIELVLAQETGFAFQTTKPHRGYY